MIQGRGALPNLGTESAYYLCANRNKKSITIDIKSAEGQKVIKDLAAESDIVVENFKMGELKKYDLDYESLSKINSKLIYCSLTGFGQNGPKSELPGYDFMIQGISGIMSITGEPNGEPTKVGVAMLSPLVRSLWKCPNWLVFMGNTFGGGFPTLPTSP